MSSKLHTIRLECPHCKTTIPYANRMPTDPPNARWALVPCPACNPGETAEAIYFDEAGRTIEMGSAAATTPAVTRSELVSATGARTTAARAVRPIARDDESVRSAPVPAVH